MLHFNQKSPAAFRTTLGDHGTSMGFRWLLVFFSMLSPNLGFISRGAIITPLLHRQTIYSNHSTWLYEWNK